jgi:hypothetical protein
MEPISVNCASCGHAMKFAPDKAGRKAKCPKCNAVFTIPTPEEAKATAAAGAAAGQDEGDGAYDVIVDRDLEEKRRRMEEEDRRRAKEAKKKKAPKIEKKFKNLPDAEEWEKVHFGLLFIFLGTCLWAFTLLLHGMWVTLGTVEFTDYSRLVTERVEKSVQQDGGIPEGGRFWSISQFNLLVGMVAGRGFVGFAKFCIIVGLILYPIQVILWMVGYILCLPVPRHHGALGQLVTMMLLNAFNFLVFIFFRLIPVTGLYRYYLIPYFLPEVMITEYNMERVFPFFVLWSGSPFWESLLALFLQFMFFLEPIMGSIFIWTIAKSLKSSRVEDNAHGVNMLGFGQYYAYLALVLISLCGTTPVLVDILRVLYILWYGFEMMFIVRYALLLWRCRDLLETRLYPEG